MTRTATRKPVERFTVTRVERVYSPADARNDVHTIPGMVCTIVEINAMGDCSPHTVNVWCDECGESVADCPRLRDRVRVPASWSWRVDAQPAGLRHVDGLVVFGG